MFTLVYGGMQAFIAWRACRAFGWTGGRRRLAWGAAVVMTGLPFLVWWVERCNCGLLSAVYAALVYGWMGYAFLLFWLALLAALLGYLLRRFTGWTSRRGFLAAAGVAAGLSLWGVYAAWHPREVHVRIVSPQLPAEMGVLRVVQITDVHLGLTMGPRRLPTILDRVRALRPDVLISTGDLVDGRAHNVSASAPLFAALRPRLGKYAITGNHEYYKGLQDALRFHEAAGFKVLRAESRELFPGVYLAGVDDPGRAGSAAASAPAHLTDSTPLLRDLPQSAFVVFMKHQPIPPPGQADKVDLQLSGHTHGGQIFPFLLLTYLKYDYGPGMHALPGGGQMYVSRGAGTWGPPMRVFAPAEVTLFELVPARLARAQPAGAQIGSPFSSR